MTLITHTKKQNIACNYNYLQYRITLCVVNTNEKNTMQKMVTTSINIDMAHLPSHGGDAENTLFLHHGKCNLSIITTFVGFNRIMFSLDSELNDY